MSRTLRIYSYARCSTCRKALAWLDLHHINYQLLDIVENPPNKDLLMQAYESLEIMNKLFNTNGASYRALGAETVKKMNTSSAIDALASDGKLIKRPFLIDEKGMVLVGFNTEIWTKALLG